MLAISVPCCSLNFIMFPIGSLPALSTKIKGLVELLCSKQSCKLNGGGMTYFCVIFSMTKSVMANAILSGRMHRRMSNFWKGSFKWKGEGNTALWASFTSYLNKPNKQKKKRKEKNVMSIQSHNILKTTTNHHHQSTNTTTNPPPPPPINKHHHQSTNTATNVHRFPIVGVAFNGIFNAFEVSCDDIVQPTKFTPSTVAQPMRCWIHFVVVGGSTTRQQKEPLIVGKITVAV